MDHKEFDDKISKQLGVTQEFPFDENQWEQLAVQLDEKKEKRRVFGWWFWGAIVGAIFLLGFAYYSFLLNQKIDQLEQKVEQFAASQQSTSIQEPTITAEAPKAIEKITPKNIVIYEEEDEGKKVENSTQRELLAIEKTTPKQSIVNINQLPEQKITNPGLEYIALSKNEESPNRESEVIVQNEKPVAEEVAVNPLIEKAETRAAILAFRLLKAKNESIDFEGNPEFALEEQRFRKPLKFMNWSAGAYASAGWKVESSNAGIGRLNSADELIEVVDFSGQNLSPTALVSRQFPKEYSVNFGQFGIKGTANFTHGFSLHTSFGRRKLLIQGPGSRSFLPALVSNNFKNDNDKLNSVEIRQDQWVLGLGIGYSPFSKWKIRPFVEITPEFSSTLRFNQDFLVEEFQPEGSGIGDPPASSEAVFYDLNFSNADRGFKLRNISNVIGVAGTFGENLYWQVNGGINWSVSNSSPSLLNRYKVGLGMGYNF